METAFRGRRSCVFSLRLHQHMGLDSCQYHVEVGISDTAAKYKDKEPRTMI